MLPHFLRMIVCCVLLMPVLAEQALAQDESESFADDATWMRKRMTTLVPRISQGVDGTCTLPTILQSTVAASACLPHESPRTARNK